MKRAAAERRCTYLLAIEDDVATDGELCDLAQYLSVLGTADVDVTIVDASPQSALERNKRVLRWVGRYIEARPQHRTLTGRLDPVRAAADVAACERVIVADPCVRYCEEALEDMCALLDLHEVVEPQDYFDPLPWWGGIDAGRMLVHRGIEPVPDRGSTFGFRRAAIRGLRGIDAAYSSGDHARRLASQGAEVFSAAHLFVRRLPPLLDAWLRRRPLEADADFVLPTRTIFFLSLLPVLAFLAAVGGVRVAGSWAGAVAFASIALAFRGRIGMAPYFPWRACLFAPLWILERSISIYWALLLRVQNVATDSRVPSPYASASNPRNASASVS